MTRTELNTIIHQPHLIGEYEISALDSLIAKFPYCQTFHVLKTKGMHNIQSLGYTEQLKLTAVTVSDRKKLYEYIMQEALLSKIAEVEKESEKIDSLPIEKVEIISKIIEPDVEVTSTKLSTSEKEKIPVVEKIEIEEVKIEPINFSKAIEKNIPLDKPIQKIESVNKKQSESESERERESEAKDEVIANEVLDVKVASKKISNLEQEILYEAINKSIQNEVYEDIQEEIKESGELIEINIDEYSGPKDFMDWLHVNDTMKPKAVKTNKEKSEEKNVELGSKSKNTEDLIEKFILSEPRITPSKAEFYSPTNIAKLSVIDTEEFVSETLAKVYEKQAYYDKAIRVYEKLSLKFPKKNAYFATLIEKIELQKAIDKQKKNK